MTSCAIGVIYDESLINFKSFINKSIYLR